MYIQCDDEPDKVGEILEKHYQDPTRVDELLLGQDLTKTQPFLPVVDYPKGEIMPPDLFDHEVLQCTIRDLYFFEDLDLWLADATECEFAYLFKENQWRRYKKVLTSRYLKPVVEILSYWIDEKGNRVTKIS